MSRIRLEEFGEWNGEGGGLCAVNVVEVRSMERVNRGATLGEDRGRRQRVLGREARGETGRPANCHTCSPPPLTPPPRITKPPSDRSPRDPSQSRGPPGDRPSQGPPSTRGPRPGGARPGGGFEPAAAGAPTAIKPRGLAPKKPSSELLRVSRQQSIHATKRRTTSFAPPSAS